MGTISRRSGSILQLPARRPFRTRVSREERHPIEEIIPVLCSQGHQLLLPFEITIGQAKELRGQYQHVWHLWGGYSPERNKGRQLLIGPSLHFWGDKVAI